VYPTRHGVSNIAPITIRLRHDLSDVAGVQGPFRGENQRNQGQKKISAPNFSSMEAIELDKM
jgi:hypothetical protein